MKNLFVVTLMMLLLVGVVQAVPVKITNQGEAYGHHGACSGWNNCGDAETCALAACKANGFTTLVSYGEGKPCTQFGVCHLFNSIGETPDVQCNWGNRCEVMGVTDIWCDDGQWASTCVYELPPQDNPPQEGEVPEFGLIGAAILVAGAVGFIVWRRR